LLWRTIEICNHSFLPRFIDEGSVVVDIGANHGDFAYAVIQRFGCRVVSAEPVKELYDGLAADPLLEVLPVAVGGKNQTIAMNIFPTRCASVLGPMTSGEEAATQSVEMVTLAEFCRRAGVDRIDLLKMDIEGAEVDLFEACSDEQLQAVRQITVEFHEFLYPEQTEPVAKILERMRRLGFWVMPFSLDNTNVLFVNRTTGVGPVEVAFLRTFVRYWKGMLRRVRRIFESRDAG
jgi:FkbM family methyltransferase